MSRRFRNGFIVLVLAVFGIAAGERGDALLIDAVRQGDTKAVRTLMGQRINVNARTVDGTTALHWAVHRNELATVEQLLRAGATVTLVNNYGVTPLAMAAENGNAAIIERLLKAGADANSVMPGGETALMTAAQTGNAGAVKVLLAHGANPNARETTREQTALMWAAARGNTAAVTLLLEAGAEVDARSSELKAFHQGTFVAGRREAKNREQIRMFTPLLFAARAGHIDAARALIDAGANVNDEGPDGTSALHVACINANWELAALLVDRGADANADGPGGTALHHIARVRGTKYLVMRGGLAPPEVTGTMTPMDLVKKLVAHGADVNARIAKPQPMYGSGNDRVVGLTPLLMTGMPADPEYMRVLLTLGADATISLPNKTTLLMMASGVALGGLLGEDEEAMSIVKTAVELGLDVNAQNEDGDTALHGAVFRGYNPLVQYLVDQGAKLDATNKIGWTPLMEARWTGRSLLNTRPETEKLLRTLYEARGLPIVVPTREEAIEKLVYGRGGPVISCPGGVTVQSSGGRPAVINYADASGQDRRNQYLSLPTKCSPSSGTEFPVGVTTVTCTTVDKDNRSDSCTVLMRVLP